MKNDFVGGSGEASSAPWKLDTTVPFLGDRRQTLALFQTGRSAAIAAYVWRRVFLKGRARRP